jgi:general secretion pathway protein G
MVKRLFATWYRHRHQGLGFTLIELLIVMAVLAILLSLVAPRYLDRVEDAREVMLKKNLVGLRDAIDHYYRDKGRYPQNLDELASARYIRSVPVDPITQSTQTWVIVPPSTGGTTVFDVKSGAEGQAKDGTGYGSW